MWQDPGDLPPICLGQHSNLLFSAGDSASQQITSRLDKLIKKAGSVIGCRQKTVGAVEERRTLNKLIDPSKHAAASATGKGSQSAHAYSHTASTRAGLCNKCGKGVWSSRHRKLFWDWFWALRMSQCAFRPSDGARSGDASHFSIQPPLQEGIPALRDLMQDKCHRS